jgi:hypothetical protein
MFFSLIGQNLSAEKIKEGVIAIFLLAAVWIFIVLFLRFKFKINFLQRLDFWLVVGTIAGMVLIKAFFLKNIGNYYLDRLPIYALLSPKVLNCWAVVFSAFLFLIFLFLWPRLVITSWKKFLFFLIIFFTFFSVSIASIRGLESLYDPFLRTGMDYFSDIVKVDDRGFLSNYHQLTSGFSMHGSTHPPGYILVLYFLDKILAHNLALIAIAVVLLGGLALIPIYFLSKKVFGNENDARFATGIFSFAPAYVIFSATSMETVFLAISAFLYLVLFLWKGVRRAIYLGFILAVAIFFNFLALLFLPLVFLVIAAEDRKFFRGALNFLVTMAVTATVFSAAKLIFGFGIIKTFLAANSANKHIVNSNFESLTIYFLYFLMNIVAFGVYLGWPVILSYFKALREAFYSFSNLRNIVLLLGLFFLTSILFVGIFQGEVERIWLFILPLFVLPAAEFIKNNNQYAVFSLLFLQIVSTEILFYTHW